VGYADRTTDSNGESAFMFKALASDPLMLIGFDLHDDEFILLPNLPVGSWWVAVSAQKAGIECHHRRLVRVVIKLRQEGKSRIRELAGFVVTNLLVVLTA